VSSQTVNKYILAWDKVGYKQEVVTPIYVYRYCTLRTLSLNIDTQNLEFKFGEMHVV